jgi:hypothetical protein
LIFALPHSISGVSLIWPNHFTAQRARFGEVPSVSQRDGALRHDALDSDAGNLPEAKGGFAPAALKGLLVAVFALLP